MQIDPLTALLQSIKSVLDQALPTDLAHSVGKDIESRMQSALKSAGELEHLIASGALHPA